MQYQRCLLNKSVAEEEEFAEAVVYGGESQRGR